MLLGAGVVLLIRNDGVRVWTTVFASKGIDLCQWRVRWKLRRDHRDGRSWLLILGRQPLLLFLDHFAGAAAGLALLSEEVEARPALAVCVRARGGRCRWC